MASAEGYAVGRHSMHSRLLAGGSVRCPIGFGAGVSLGRRRRVWNGRRLAPVYPPRSPTSMACLRAAFSVCLGYSRKILLVLSVTECLTQTGRRRLKFRRLLRAHSCRSGSVARFSEAVIEPARCVRAGGGGTAGSWDCPIRASQGPRTGDRLWVGDPKAKFPATHRGHGAPDYYEHRENVFIPT
jgi:hypothetical protein